MKSILLQFNESNYEHGYEELLECEDNVDLQTPIGASIIGFVAGRMQMNDDEPLYHMFLHSDATMGQLELLLERCPHVELVYIDHPY